MLAELESRTSKLKRARTVFAIVFGLNLLLASAKLICGFSTGASSMVADGFHSVLDASSNIIGIMALSISLKPADPEHPYGHRKFEAMAAIAISFFMFLASFEILSEVLHRIVSSEVHIAKVGLLSYTIMFVTVTLNLLVARFEERKSKELDSKLLGGDAKHTLSDLYASLTVLVSLVAIQLRFPTLDILASLIIVLVIFKSGFEIIVEHMGILVDAAALDPNYLERLVLEVPGVMGCHKIRSRGMQDHIFIDLHVEVSKHLSVQEAHSISYLVEEKLIAAGNGIVDVIVHIEEENHSLADRI
jgi:cation diffusion facilitator family transporter